MADRWFIEDAGDDDFGYQWNLMLLENGKLRCIAEYHDEAHATNALAAHKWLDAFREGRMSLSMEGIVIDGNTGVIRKARKKVEKKPVPVRKR